MKSKLTREQLRERAQLKAKNLASAISQSAFASCRSELEEELQFLQCALACMEDEPVEPIWGAKKYPVCRPVPGAKLIVWDETGKFVGYGSSVDTRESGVAIQISVGHRLDSNHDLRWQYALQPVPAMNSEPHPDDELSNLLWYSQEATCHSDPNYYCEFQRLATPGFIAGIILELQERRKAEMNSEPYGFTDGDRRGMIYEPQYADRLNNPIPVYRHAQPGPVVDSEPVAESVTCWSCRNEVEISAIGDCDGYCPKCDAPIDLDEEPYTSPQPAPDREQVRSEHAEWSQATFGNVGPIGPLKHLRREVLEAIAKPHDLIEWADMQFLLWDAQRRAGITDEQITQAMIEKLAVNKQREWPEPKDGEPRLHIKAQPAPVVLKDHQIRELINQLRDIAIKYHAAGQLREQIARTLRAAMLQASNSPVIPDGWKLVPVEPNGDMLAAAQDAYGETEGDIASTLRAAITAAPQEVKGE